jgi:hypothetical protein
MISSIAAAIRIERDVSPPFSQRMQSAELSLHPLRENRERE